MTALLRASISLDGKLIAASGKPLRRCIPVSKLAEARELVLTIHPVIVGEGGVPSLSALPGGFLSEEISWELFSVVNSKKGTTVVRYRRKP